MNKKDKADERYEARLDRYHTDLRAALSEFCAAAGSFLDRGNQMVAIEMAIQSVEDDGFAELVKNGCPEQEARTKPQHDVDADFKMRYRQGLDEFMSASTAAEAKGVGVLLLLGETPMRDDVRFIGISSWDVPTNKEQVKTFISDLQARRERLDELIKKLAGLLVPERPTAGELEEPTTSTRPRLLP